ncbi:unnamed protein product [Lepeophtheirus salmonis]|uniref:(salmon louse) hypothetical protein n=1 Tax=Lepeophtheirus salmonis TaxID=72036 RepID=A0A7R8CZD0_LEPSM|nr:unnamed protein product [Lepeophtheirus salmonis]CAF2974904.1 unnamed protein product [Lepeophtheirus salmonis]
MAKRSSPGSSIVENNSASYEDSSYRNKAALKRPLFEAGYVTLSSESSLRSRCPHRQDHQLLSLVKSQAVSRGRSNAPLDNSLLSTYESPTSDRDNSRHQL